MSGPKTSLYTLTPEQRQRVMTAYLRRFLQREHAALSAQLAQLENKMRRAQAYDPDKAQPDAEKVKRLIEKYAPLLTPDLPDDREEMNSQIDALRGARQTLAKMDRSMQSTVKKAKEAWEKRTEQALRQGYGDILNSALDEKRGQRQQEHQKRMELLNEIISSAVRDETAGQAQKLLNQYRQADTDAFRDTLFTTAIQPLLRQHQAEEAQYRREENAYQVLLMQYAGLCEELGEPVVPQPWSPGAAQALQAAVSRMEARVLQREEEAYICRALDEVMREMGYPLLGTREVTKRSGRRFRHALYTFGDGTAIDVTYSDDGQIAMELGGLDDKDRIPDEAETICLCDAMEGFCTSFQQIEERLKKRGVVLKERIRLLPPTEENAQIINAADYQLSAVPALLDAAQRAAQERKKKQMYKDEE